MTTPALRKLIDWHIAEGTDCIGVVGTTGESPTVNVEEHCEIIRVAVEQAAKRVPIMAGCGANPLPKPSNWPSSPRRSAPTRQLQVVPYYNKPTQEGQYQHFKAIAEAVATCPILYNVPGRSVADMQHDTVLRLAQVPGIIGIKEATGNIERAQWLIREAPGLWHLLGRRPHRRRPDAVRRPWQHQRHSQRGPALMHELCVAAIAGDARRAMEIQFQLMPVHKHLFVEANPIPVKWAVARMGLCGGTLRLPMTPLSKSNEAVVEARCAAAACSEPRTSPTFQARFPSERKYPPGPAGPCCCPVSLLDPSRRRQDRLQKRHQGLDPGSAPDLTQLAKDSRYAVPGGTVSQPPSLQAQQAAQPSAASQAAATPSVTCALSAMATSAGSWSTAPQTSCGSPCASSGWRTVSSSPDQANLGILETDWAENRAKLPQDVVRAALGKVFDSLYSTGERDKFRTRLERNANGGTDIFISHRGMIEVYANTQKDQTVWQPRAADPELETEFLRRLMVKLGVSQEQSRRLPPPRLRSKPRQPALPR